MYGAGKIPQLGEGVGKAVQGFKRSTPQDEASPSVDAHSSAAEEKQKRGTTGSPRVDLREDVQRNKRI
ncbi:MAG: twin-arginine translocase TatA/TatE family subunit [Nitrospirota bacterium]|nr:twin-arginine translocase TatA/TatE family subunit [Nitrospirota bacterium]